MPAERKQIDWEAVEREYRAGQLSVREIARRFGLTEGAIRKRAKADSWERPLADKVRAAVREKLVRADGAQDGTQDQRAKHDADIIQGASARGFEVQMSHRRDIAQLHGLKRMLADRLAIYLDGGDPDGPCFGEKESPSDLLEKLSRVTARLIPLERQAFNLDAEKTDSGASKIFDLTRLTDDELTAIQRIQGRLAVAGSGAGGDREAGG